MEVQASVMRKVNRWMRMVSEGKPSHPVKLAFGCRRFQNILEFKPPLFLIVMSFLLIII